MLKGSFYGRPISVVNIYLVGALEATFLVQSTWNLVKMFNLIKSRTSKSLCQLGSLTRSLGQIKEIPCGHSRQHLFK